MMAYNYDVLVGIELLMSAAGDVAHGDEFASSNAGELELPRLTNVE
jgi:hypothetical protein